MISRRIHYAKNQQGRVKATQCNERIEQSRKIKSDCWCGLVEKIRRHLNQIWKKMEKLN